MNEVDIVSVLGNESRVKQEMTFSNEAFSDNYDFTIGYHANIDRERGDS